MKNKNIEQTGCLIVSLDFEMMWGVIDIATPDDYGKTNVRQVSEVIHRMVELFEKYSVNATFASVGMLMLDGVQKVKELMPNLQPTYRNNKLSPYSNGYLDEIKGNDVGLYFAPKLIEYLRLSKNVELGTHTFCHYYCYEAGQTLEQFEADLKTAILVARGIGLSMKSIIFPKNQVSKDYLKVCAKYGIESYCGNPDKFFNKPKSSFDAIKNKIGRLLDAYINIGGRTSYPLSSIDVTEMPMNIKASRMFRPYMKNLSFFEPLRIRRIKREMVMAAKHGEIYHLWWHPHNFGADMEQNFANLKKVLECYRICHEKYGMASMTMNELTNIIKGKR